MSAPLTVELFRSHLKEAMKGGQQLRVSTLRLLLAAVRNKEIELGQPADEKVLAGLLKSGVKKRREAIEAYEKSGRQDLADKEREEEKILSAYLPRQLSEEEISALAESVIRDGGAAGLKDMGRVIKEVMARAEGRADGRQVSEIVKARLS